MAKNQGKLGLVESSTILIGGMIGSAIFSLSGITIMNAGPASILSWIVAGVILFGYGLLNAELSTIYPNSGGVFMFPAKSLGRTPEQGRFWGWLSSWAYLCSCWGGAAFSAIYVGTYLSVAFPALANLQVPLALLATLLCGVLNVFKISVTGKVSIIMTGTLVVTMLIFIGVGLCGGQWDGALLTPFFTQGAQGRFSFLSAIPIAMVAYGSIVAVAFMVGEIKDPNKNVPRAMVIAMSIVITVYSLVMLTTLGLVTAGFLQQNPEMTYIPLYAAAFTKLAHIPWLPALISISATLALLTAMLVLIALASRTVQAAAMSGILPKVLGKNNAKTGVPLNATILVTVAFGVLASFPMFTEFIINLGAMCNVIVVSIICITVIAARRKNPGVKAFRAPGGNVLPVLILVVLVTCYVPKILTGGWQLWAFTAGYILVGLIIYFSNAKGRKSHKDLLTY